MTFLSDFDKIDMRHIKSTSFIAKSLKSQEEKRKAMRIKTKVFFFPLSLSPWETPESFHKKMMFCHQSLKERLKKSLHGRDNKYFALICTKLRTNIVRTK